MKSLLLRFDRPVVKSDMPGKSAADRAFTLVELLVVIAIIAILAAMLLPTLSKAKQSSYRVADLNNLKQSGVAMNLVTADNNDVMPWPNWASGEQARPGPQDVMNGAVCGYGGINTAVKLSQLSPAGMARLPASEFLMVRPGC